MTAAHTSEAEQDSPSAGTDAPGQARVSMGLRSGLGAALIVALALLLAVDAAWEEGFLYAGVMTAVVALALAEFGDLVRRIGLPAPPTALVAGGAGLFLLMWSAWAAGRPDPWLVGFAFLPAGAGCLLSARVIRGDLEEGLQSAAAALTGWIYLPALLGFLTAIRLDFGVSGLITVVGVCKASSAGAYFVGSLLGRHKLSPRVSPKKTIEGAAGAVLGSILVAWALSHSPWSVMRPRTALLFGAFIAGAAMMGDLSASLLKRQASVKDSGRLVPGFGGMLDMLDDVLFAAPVGYAFLKVCQLAAGG